MDINPEIIDRLKKLEHKYEAMGQDMLSYLDGLLYADTINYWKYVHLDTLLSLQTPETPFKDEMIFIVYHQITELYFKLCLHAIDQICDAPELCLKIFKTQLTRVNHYFDIMINSFDVMVQGMDQEQFLKFRMTLLPASGFQSAQYRKIELYSTSIINLVHHSVRKQLVKASDITEMYEHIYWRKGATELATGKKTLTLREFENKYSHEFIHLIRDYYHKNLWMKYVQLKKEHGVDEELVSLLRAYDVKANIEWPLAHYRSAVKHLQKEPEDIAATGGTNWQKYLPPKNQLITFYPELWTDEEKSDWGKRLQNK